MHISGFKIFREFWWTDNNVITQKILYLCRWNILMACVLCTVITKSVNMFIIRGDLL